MWKLVIFNLFFFYSLYCVAQQRDCGIINGIVTDAKTKEKIRRVKIYLSYSSSPFIAIDSSITDKKGFYQFEKLNPEILYNLTINRKNYPEDNKVNISANCEATKADFQITFLYGIGPCGTITDTFFLYKNHRIDRAYFSNSIFVINTDIFNLNEFHQISKIALFDSLQNNLKTLRMYFYESSKKKYKYFKTVTAKNIVDIYTFPMTKQERKKERMKIMAKLMCAG